MALGTVDHAAVDKHREILKYYAAGQAFEVRHTNSRTSNGHGSSPVVISKAIRPARLLRDPGQEARRASEEIVKTSRYAGSAISYH